MLKQLVMDTAVQWILFFIIPIIVYLLFFRKKTKFTHFLGLKKHRKVDKNLLLQTSLVSIVFIFMSINWLQKYNLGADDIRLLSFQKTGFSIETILIIFIQSIIRTSFLEEIIFRGFLINSFKEKLGFNIANHFQALIFTGLHIFAMSAFPLIDIVAGTTIVYLLSLSFGKLTQESGYSVFYSSVFHGLLNLIAGVVFIFMAA